MSKLPKSNSDTGNRPPNTPRWVKVSGIIAIVLILLVFIMMFIGGGNHGPGRHLSGEQLAEQIEQEAPGKQAQSDARHKPSGGGH